MSKKKAMGNWLQKIKDSLHQIETVTDNQKHFLISLLD